MKKEKYVDKKGEIKTRIEFYPKRNSDNPLTGVKCFILEESTLTDLKLFSELEEALPKDCVKIFLGDLNQLPPVFGQSILAEKLASGTPFVELTKVYRQKGGSPILDIVLACINGKAYSGELLKKLFHKDTPNGKVSLNLLKKKISPEAAEQIYLHNWLPKILKNGEYVPGRDVFLLPFNKALGTIEANKVINQYYSQKAGNPVYEVIAGWAPYYFAKGDFLDYRLRKKILAVKDIGYTECVSVSVPGSVTVDRFSDDSCLIPNGSVSGAIGCMASVIVGAPASITNSVRISKGGVVCGTIEKPEEGYKLENDKCFNVSIPAVVPIGFPDNVPAW